MSLPFNLQYNEPFMDQLAKKFNINLKIPEVQDKSVSELFKDYQNQIFLETKKKDLDYVKEVFATTELFDFSNLVFKHRVTIEIEDRGDCLVSTLPSEIVLPFSRCFIKLYKDTEEINSLFIREYIPKDEDEEFNPYILTGAFFGMTSIFQYTVPFTLDLKTLKLSILKNCLNKSTGMLFDSNASYSEKLYVYAQQFTDVATMIILSTTVLDNLNKHAIYIDHLKKPEYCTFKNKQKPTIKICNRPIYYVLDKKTAEQTKTKIVPYTKLSYSHAFSVKGHWRLYNSANKFGKNRQGIRCVKGWTWVTDYIKGSGEFVQRERVARGVKSATVF